ncbi:MAG: PAS domain S-box protein [Bacteroidales bacterium]|nr:PAS domain S-box protein [Bacteroidales bacterium]
MNILLLEDNTVDADLAIREIKRNMTDTNVDLATSLVMARELLQQENKYDIGLFDIRLPDGNGMDLLVDLRQGQIPMAVIMLTGSGNEEMAVAALQAGAEDYIVKKKGYISLLPKTIEYNINSFKQKLTHASNIIHVLYIEHHSQDIDLTKRHLKQYAPQIRLETVSTVSEALKKIPEEASASCKYHVLLMDYKLPGLNALELIKTIRQERNLTLPIMLVTGQGSEEIAIQALKLGADEYLMKSENYLFRLPSMIINAYQRQELKLNQKALLDSESKYRLLADNSGDVIFVLNMNLKYTYISPAVKFLRGFTAEEAIKQDLSFVLTPESYNRALSEIKEVLSNFKDGNENRVSPRVLELEMTRKDSTTIWTEVKASLMIDENKIPTGILGVTRDISKRKAAEIELYRSREEYRMFFEDDLTGDFISTVDGKLINCNPAFIKMLGFSSKEEALGSNTKNMYKNSGLRNEIIALLGKNRKLENFEFELIRKNGAIIYIIANIVGVYDTDDKLVYLKGYLVDNTERKLVADELRKLSRAVEQSPVSIIITDTDGNIEYVNPRFSEITGFSFEEAKSKKPGIIKSGFTPPEEYDNLWKTIKSGNEWHGEFLNKRKNGTLFWENASISPIRNKDGKITHFLGVKEDITEKKNYEQQLLLAKEKAEESDKLKTAFLHNISHEVRTPMNAIVGFSELLNNPNLPADKIKYFTDVISKNSTQLLAIITDIVNVATIEAGQEKIYEKDVNINYLLNNLYLKYNLKAKEKNLEIKYNTALSDVQAQIRTDETKLLQILINLIENAIKFTQKGKITFGYRLKSDFIEFFVKDSGIGIPVENHNVIFERFHQVHNTITDKSGGTGLGLTISKAYVELLGGEIWLKSSPGEGTKFYFTIPYNSPEIQNTLNETENVEEINGFKKNRTILIAEDEEYNFLLLEEMLAELNLTIIRAHNGIEAVEICKNNSAIKLVLMDIKMPLLNGDEATKQIKQFLPQLPIIAQTAYGLDIDRNKIMDSGFDEYIGKPIDRQILLRLINKNLKNK